MRNTKRCRRVAGTYAIKTLTLGGKVQHPCPLPGKKVLWFYFSFTIVFLKEIGTVKLWASTQCIFPI